VRGEVVRTPDIKEHLEGKKVGWGYIHFYLQSGDEETDQSSLFLFSIKKLGWGWKKRGEVDCHPLPKKKKKQPLADLSTTYFTWGKRRKRKKKRYVQ